MSGYSISENTFNTDSDDVIDASIDQSPSTSILKPPAHGRKFVRQILDSDDSTFEDSDHPSKSSFISENDEHTPAKSSYTSAAADSPSPEIVDSDDEVIGYSPRNVAMSTPRNPAPLIPSRSPSPESIIDISDDEDDANIPPPSSSSSVNPGEVECKKQVSYLTYQAQLDLIKDLQNQVVSTENALRTLNLQRLPDKGQLLIESNKKVKDRLAEAKKSLANMESSGLSEAPAKAQIVNWAEVEAGVGEVMPRTFGKRGMENFRIEKALTVERLELLHGSLKSRPAENVLASDPKGLKIELMEHQKHAVSWMLWRENQKPAGGILADDMGLGKTLTVISLLLKVREEEGDNDAPTTSRSGKFPGGTLIVCPASLINQWSGEVKNRTKRGLISVEVHHGSSREDRPKRLAKYDMVVTTYGLAVSECARNGALFNIKWKRIVLDEAHQIRNYKTQTSEAVCQLSGKCRWVLTGTPVHNKELDMYGLFKFLRCSPFDDITVWKHWVADKSAGGQERLHTVISSLMLRRTKEEMMKKSKIFSLPERKWEIIPVTLNKDEQEVYQRVLIFSRTLFAQFLHQRAAKNQDALEVQMQINKDPNSEYFKIRNKLLKINKVKEVSQHEILVLLLRLRQICCHPSLITKMLEGNEDLGEGDGPEDSEELNLLDQLNKLQLGDEDPEDHDSFVAGSGDSATLNEAASNGYLNPSHPVFQKDRISSKFKILINLLKEKLPGGDKAIIVSQWTGLLDLLAYQFDQEGFTYGRLDGSVAIKNRTPIVDDFNDSKSKMKVLLLSLTAGGVGLNLVGANHLILLDLHWNPQLENQAQDRIYRMGQNKPVFVHKLMVVDTIEQRVQDLQEKKLAIADAILTGHKQVVSSKLTLQDMKTLFGF